VPLLVGARLDEELHLHLLELARAEDEVAWRDLVAEALADLPDAERRLAPGRRHDLPEVHEDALGGLRSQVGQTLLALDRAEEGLQQAVEHLRLGPGAFGAAVGAGDDAEVDGVRVGDALLPRVRLLQVVGAKALVAGLAFHQRVDELRDVSGGLPDRARKNDRGVQADDVVAPLDHGLPPLPLDVLLQLHAERSVVPGERVPP
jgi:hypothetical protein